MNTPGIKVDPIIMLSGEHELNQVFFDDVRVPVSGRLGEENDGWTVAKYLLEFERSGGSSAGLAEAIRRLRRFVVKNVSDDTGLRAKLERASILVESILITEQRIVAAVSKNGSPGPAASILKVQRTELMQLVDEISIAAKGIYAGVHQPDSWVPLANVETLGPEELTVSMAKYLNNRAASIYGGSNQVQRNIVAKAVLAL